MRRRFLEWLACPACGATDLELSAERTEVRPVPLPGREGPDVVVKEGVLACPECGSRWPIRDGIPRMLPDGQDDGPASGHRWTRFDGRDPEYAENFADLTWPLRPEDFLGKLVLDAGCGFGRHAFFAARYGAEVVALDRSADAVEAAAANCVGFDRVHVVQGDLLQPPLRPEAFDITFGFGVLHHLSDPHAGFLALSGTVRPGGRLMTWVAGPRQGLVGMVSGALRGAATAMTDEQLHDLSRVLAVLLRVSSHTPYRLLHGLPVLRDIATRFPGHDHHKWPFDVVVADIYDRLRIPIRHFIKGEELERWFADEGYVDIEVTRRVRNNESFRGTAIRR